MIFVFLGKVRKGDFTPSQYKEIPHKKVFGTTLRVGSEGGLLTPSIGCHPEERSDEGSPHIN
jgi:hypothetical protein